jgi:hypothetical protein
MISRGQAREIAESVVISQKLGRGVLNVVSVDEIQGRVPSIYGVPDLVGVWVAYVARELVGLRASLVVLVSRATGDVVYAGSANDEG